jgi:hypothetical protein
LVSGKADHDRRADVFWTPVRPNSDRSGNTRELGAYFKYRNSHNFRLDNLSAGIGPLPPAQIAADSTSTVTAFRRNRGQLSVRVAGRLAPDFATPTMFRNLLGVSLRRLTHER